MTRRTKKLSRELTIGRCHEGARLSFFVISGRDDLVVEAIKAAKLEGRQQARDKIRDVMNLYLDKFFPDFHVTCPRGSNRNNLMLSVIADRPDFLPCFDYSEPLAVKHHWSVRVHDYPRIEVVCDVRDKWIVLADDVTTTFTTLSAHLLALLEAGAYATGLVLTTR